MGDLVVIAGDVDAELCVVVVDRCDHGGGERAGQRVAFGRAEHASEACLGSIEGLDRDENRTHHGHTLR